MRCFLPCFGSSKRPNHVVTEGQTHATLESAVTELTEQTIDYITQSKVNFEGQSNSSVRKKITVDLNVNIRKELSIKELFNKLEESKREQGEARVNETLKIYGCAKAIAQSNSCNRPETRYQKISENEKKREEDENGGVDWKLLQEESSESLFSLSIDSRKRVSADEKAENEVDSLMPLHHTICLTEEESNHNVSKILNPIENFAEENSVKGTGIQPIKKEAKDNVNLSRTELQEQSNGIAKRKDTFDLNVSANVKQEKAREETTQASESPKSTASIRPTSNSSNYRYRDCPDEGYEDINLYESDFDDISVNDDPEDRQKVEGDFNGTWWEEESSESLFSVSIDSRKRIHAGERPENEVNSPISVRDKLCSKEEEMEAFGASQEARIHHASSSVLNPIENTQGKFVKTTIVRPLKHEEKENINIMQDNDLPYTPKPSLKPTIHKSRQKFNDDEQIGVDTSLSSWLVETKTTKSKNSMNSVVDSPLKDRPILGALTVEALRLFSASTSPTLRRSRSPSPDETAIIGTVGSYWGHTGQALDSNSSSSCVLMPNSGSKSTKVLLS